MMNQYVHCSDNWSPTLVIYPMKPRIKIKRKQLTDMRLTDELILNSEVTALKGGASKLVCELDIRELQQRQINSLELHVSSQPWNAVSQADTYSYNIAFSIAHIAYTPTVKLTCEEISPGYCPQQSGWQVI